MRERKFKAKRIDNGDWVYGNYIEKINPHIKKNTFWCSLIHDRAISSIEVHPKTVGQFTGLKIGEKEVYKGDVGTAKVNGTETHIEFLDFEVIWLREQCAFALKVISEGSDYKYLAMNDRNILSLKITGNIHD